MSVLYFVAGETSGDNHGAELLRALRERDPHLQFFGRGGPKMRAIAGQEFRDWIEQAAVVGLWEVLKHYLFFRREFAATIHEIADLKPAAVVLIDYPGFNLRLARVLRKQLPALKIIYYISPQVWAWNQRRVSAMARSIDLMLCIFPFEPELYDKAGLHAVFVGHPIAAVIPSGVEGSRHANVQATSQYASPSLCSVRDTRLIGIFPGSREREVKKIFPVMEKAARELLRTHPELRFEVAAASPPLARSIAALASNPAMFSFSPRGAHELMRRASAAMIASGTATLEAALWRLPFVLVYRVAWLTYFAARLVVKVKYLGMPNVLANRALAPEFIQHKARPAAIARALAHLLDDANARESMLAAFDAVSQNLGRGRANVNAANAIMAELES